MIRACLFDFDGTIADTAPTIIFTFHATFEETGLADCTDDQIRATIGLPLNTSFMVLHPEIDPKRAQELCEVYRKIYAARAFKKLVMYPHIEETLKRCQAQGMKLAVVSSKRTEMIVQMTQTLGIDTLFSALLGEDAVLNKKPAPDMALKALELLGGIPADEAVVIGDSAYDIEMGERAGCHTIWAAYGYGTEEAVGPKNPNRIARAPKDVWGQIAALSGIKEAV